MEDFVTTVIAALLRPVAGIAIDGDSRYFWPYLVGALLVALLLFRRERGTGVGAFLRYVAPKAIWAHAGARTDLKLICVNSVIMAVSGLLAFAGPTALAIVLVGEAPASAGAQLPLAIAYTVVIFLVADFTHWLVHWLHHRIPLLWAFHKVHHSAEVLHPFTADRFHPLEIVLTSYAHGLALGVTTALFWLAAPGLSPVTVVGANALLFAFNLFAGALRHSHLWFAFPARVSRWLVSPAMHQIHHSAEERHWDKNMGGTLSVWDRLFGTLYVPEKREEFSLGVGEGTEEYRRLWHCYAAPFGEAAALIKGRPRAPTPVDARPAI